MNDTLNTYTPINCGFHDYLEHFATLRSKVTLIYKDGDKTITLKNAVLFDLSGGRNGEYAHVRTSEREFRLRMDYIISIDEIKATSIKTHNYC